MKVSFPAASRLLVTVLILVGVALVLVGLFSPWVPHRVAGLALTGFEIAEWIKFAPEVQDGTASVRRTNFYWPATAAAVALAALAAVQLDHGQLFGWIGVILTSALSLLPLPLLEEISSLGGVRASLGRLSLVGLGLMSAGLAVWARKLSPRVWGIGLALTSGAALLLVSSAFAAAEPVIERLYNHLIEPGLGYHLVRGGILTLFLAGLTLTWDR